MPKPIFLDDPSILPWERPLPKGSISMLRFANGKTIPVGFCGIEALNISQGIYRVGGSAAVYVADISHVPTGEESGFLWEREDRTQRELLLLGGIQIYKKGKVPGTKVNGYDLKASGRICYSTPFGEGYFEGLLSRVVLGSGSRSNIARIISGYEMQAKSKGDDLERQDRRNRTLGSMNEGKW